MTTSPGDHYTSSESASSKAEEPVEPRRSEQSASPQPPSSYTHDLQRLRERESAQIAVRREQVQLDPDVPSTCGLALSGGGIRSASFNLGVLQALHRTGFFRFVDYLSTVSGGGYLGAKLATHACETRTGPQEGFPLAEVDAGHKQSRDVLRLTYGGYYLLRPLSLLNKYLIGVVFNNLAVLTAMVAVCASVAFLWRSLDYPWVRDRLALFYLGSDLVAPFIPFFLLAACWIVAWVLSYFQRQAEAPGNVARFLFVLMGASALIGCAILIGNGDIALPSTSGPTEGSNLISIPTQVWGPLLGLILVAALPVLRPQRLLRSGTRPEHVWEKWVFNATSVALLCGLPLCLIGWFARENISGYSTSPNRGFHRAEVLSWPALTSLVLHGDDELFAAQSIPEAPSNPQLQNMFRLLARLNPFSPPRAFRALRQAPDQSEAVLQGGLTGPDQFPEHDRTVRKLSSSEWDFLLQNIDDEKLFVEQLEQLSERSWTFSEEMTARQIIGSFNALLADRDADPPAAIPVWSLDTDNATFENLPEVVQKRPMTFLQFLAIRIIKAAHEMDIAQREFDNLDQSQEWKAVDYHISQWEPLRIDDYFKRCLSIGGWACGLENTAAARYMQAREQFLRLQEQFVIVFNLCVLPTTELTDNLSRYKPVIEARDEGKSASDKDAEQFRDLLFAANVAGASDVHDQNLAGINRELLTVVFPDVFRPVTDYQRRVVIYADQSDRAILIAIALAAFVGIGIWVDVNATSMHRFYRVQLVTAFLSDYPRATKRSLSEITPQRYGYPYPLFCASVSMFRRQLFTKPREEMPSVDKQDFDPRWVDTFVFSSEWCGSCNTGFVPTEELEQHIVGFNTLTIGEVMALSGAAVSPSQNPNWLIAFMMFALNLRLGQWLPRPGGPKPRTRPRFITIFKSLTKPADERQYCFVSDGGHSENLGLVELLKRRCRLILVSDASQDQEHIFADLARAMRTARIHGGVRIMALTDEPPGTDPAADTPWPAALPEQELNLEPLQLQPARQDHRRPAQSEPEPLPLKRCKQHFLAARILYPARDGQDASEGLLIYFKPSITGDESADILEYRQEHRQFPHEPTSDQLFSPEQVEAYRSLGYHIAMQLCQTLLPETQQSLWSETMSDETAESLAEGMQQRYQAWHAEQMEQAARTETETPKKRTTASRPRQKRSAK